MIDLEHLRGATDIRLIMVCMGNICRSPAAEVVMRDRLERHGLTHITVDSAGTGNWHEGDGADRRSVNAWEARGYRHTHRARAFRREWASERDLILVMDENNHSTLVSRHPQAGERIAYLRSFDPALSHVDPAAEPDLLEVPDPYYGGADGFESMLDMIERACDGLAQRLADLR